jgi:signal transduction histidine kinase
MSCPDARSAHEKVDKNMRVVKNATTENRQPVARGCFECDHDSEQSLVERILDLEAQVDQLQTLAKELRHDAQRERRELAVVLHDQVQQLLVGTRMFANCLSCSVRDAGDKQLATQIDDLLGQTIAEIRALTNRLGPLPICPTLTGTMNRVDIGHG